jgi:hypothetical protein
MGLRKTVGGPTTEKDLIEAVTAFMEVDKRVRLGELRPWGRRFKAAMENLRKIYDRMKD